jgi:hypothetical protein
MILLRRPWTYYRRDLETEATVCGRSGQYTKVKTMTVSIEMT